MLLSRHSTNKKGAIERGEKTHRERKMTFFLFALNFDISFLFFVFSGYNPKKNAIYWSTVRFFFHMSPVYTQNVHVKNYIHSITKIILVFHSKSAISLKKKRNSYKKSTWCILKIDVCVSVFVALFFWSIHNRSNENRVHHRALKTCEPSNHCVICVCICTIFTESLQWIRQQNGCFLPRLLIGLFWILHYWPTFGELKFKDCCIQILYRHL